MDDRTKQALFERYVDGRMTAADQSKFAALRKSEPEFAARVAKDEKVDAIFRRGTEVDFRPFFAARVMRRVESGARDRQVDTASMLVRFFPRIASPAVAITLVFMAQNYVAATKGTPFVEALFGVPSDLYLAFFGG